MSGHLLLVTLGPVQDFIAQARRTRDLWFGSHLLSEISRVAAMAVVANGGRLVFPALDKDIPQDAAELSVCLEPLRADGRPPLNVANKILAEVPAGKDPSVVAADVRRSIQQFWVATAGDVGKSCVGLLASGANVKAAWHEQVESALDFAATWAPLGNYPDARKAVEQAIAARKNLRDFEPWTKQRGNVPKSSLDGARDTVLRKPKADRAGNPGRDKALVRKFRIADGEQLDAVGLVKRAGGRPDQFVPVVNVALASWLETAEREAPKAVAALRKECMDLGLARVDRRDLPCAQPFGFDASILLPSRWRSLFDEQGLGTPEEAHAWGRAHVQDLLKRMSEPYPYVVCLVADGDHMGAAIDKMQDAAAHRTFSRNLAKFASDARRIVEQEHRGSLVYAGGDDVLAFLPLPQGLACAEALRQCFFEIMEEACASIRQARDFIPPTLSVGLGIGHVMEGMGDLLELGRKAEKLAKGGEFSKERRDRNALAILLDKRSGGIRSWRARWSDWDGAPVGRIIGDVDALKDQLSSRKVYEIARILAHLPDASNVAEADLPGWSRVLGREVSRSLARIEGGNGGPLKPDLLQAFGLSLDSDLDYAQLRKEVTAWVDRMLIARTLAEAQPFSRGEAQEAAA